MPTFHDPLWLLLLPVLALIALAGIRKRRSRAIVFSDVSIPRSLPRTFALQVKQFLPVLFHAGMALLIVALARPQWGRTVERVNTEGIAIEMLIDKSDSMRALDFRIGLSRVNRLDATKHVFRQFVAGSDDLAGRPDDMVGLIAFGGYYDDLCPPTQDHDMMLDQLDEIEIPTFEFDDQDRVVNYQYVQEAAKTAIGDAVMQGIKRLENCQAKSKVLILLTDGAQTTGAVQPREAAEAAKALGIKIYTIAVGRNGPVRVPVLDQRGKPVLDLLGRPRTTLVEYPVDTDTLQAMAKTTKGRYYHAENTEALASVYEEIDQLEKTEVKRLDFTSYDEWFTVPMFAGMALVLANVLLVSTRFRSLP